jgi:hypothetical protein
LAHEVLQILEKAVIDLLFDSANRVTCYWKQNSFNGRLNSLLKKPLPSTLSIFSETLSAKLRR